MGTLHSDLRTPFSKKVPKHLRPAKPKKAPSTTTVKSRQPTIDAEAVAAANAAIGAVGSPVFLQTVFIPDTTFLDDQDSSLLVGSGPRGAFKWFKGRRFLTDETSLLPNDQNELDRMRVLSFILRWIFKGNVVAPVEEDLKKGINVLNIGHGPGMWTGHYIIDMALDYRQSNFTAIDICDLLPADFEKNMMSDTQEQINVPRTMFTPQHPNLPPHLNTTSDVTTSTESSSFDDSSCSSTTYSAHSSTKTNQPHRQLLPNLDFYKFNPLECRLPFEDNHFDFIMQRMVTTAYSQEDWKHILPELLRVTKPGGYIQLVEIDYYTIDLGPKGKAWETSVIDTIRLKRQMEPRMARYLPELLNSLGLIDVTDKLVSVPLGSWGLDLGVLWRNNTEAFAESTAPLLSRVMNISVDEYKAHWKVYFDELVGRKPFSNVHTAWGRVSDDPNSAIDWSLCPPLSS